MKKRYTPKWVNPKPIMAHFSEIFKEIAVKKTQKRNLLLVILAVCVAHTFRIREIAARLPISVKTNKSKEKRLLRFLETEFPIDPATRAYCLFVLRCVWEKVPRTRRFLLVDETDLLNDYKAIGASIPFRNRAIPVFFRVYTDEDIRNMTYKSHNTLVRDFCQTLHAIASEVAAKPVLVFDRGFARAKYIIAFLKAHEIAFVMRVCRNVCVTVKGSSRRLDDLTKGSYPNVLYHNTHQIPLNLYIVRDPAFKEPMYLISNHYTGPQIHACYKRRMQIEHGFRDIKTRFGFGELVLKNPPNPAWLSYG